MKRYLLIESRDPYASRGVEEHADLAIRLKGAGHPVTLYLVQNGVMPARPGARHEALERLLAARVEVLADEFSLEERGIDAAGLAAGVRRASIDLVVERMVAGWTALWH